MPVEFVKKYFQCMKFTHSVGKFRHTEIKGLIGITLYTTQQTRGIHPMLFQCWPTVFDAGPTLKQHWVNAPCLLGSPALPFCVVIIVYVG